MTQPPSEPPPPDDRRRRVVDDLGLAMGALRQGDAVVLLTGPEPAPDGAPELKQRGSRPEPDGGRLALFIGDPSNPVHRELAATMADELFPVRPPAP